MKDRTTQLKREEKETDKIKLKDRQPNKRRKAKTTKENTESVNDRRIPIPGTIQPIKKRTLA